MFNYFGPVARIWIGLITILFPLLYFFYIKVIRRSPRIEKCLEFLPGPPKRFMFGNAIELLVPNHEIVSILHNWMDTYGKTYCMWLGKNAYVVIAESSTAEKILSSNTLISKSREYDFIRNWLKEGLLTSNGKKWHTRRKLLTPAFHFKILDDFLEIFNEQSLILAKILQNQHCDGKVFDIFPIFTRCALDIIAETAMGVKIDAQSQKDSQYVQAVYGIGELVVQRVLRPWLQNKIVWMLSPQGREEKKFIKILHDYTRAVIKERKLEKSKVKNENLIAEEKKEDENEISFSKRKRLAFLDLLLDISEDGKVLSDSDIQEETDTFMFEGHDTTAANMNWTAYLIAVHTDYQRKVQSELDEIFGDDRTRAVTQADLSKMKYLELCIKESLRLYPSVPFFGRKLTQDVDLGDGNFLPKGAVGFIASYLLHRNANVFPDPLKFDPNRFIQENSIGRSPYAYVPFSAGPRNCIGQKFAMMEEKVVLSSIFRNFNVKAGEKWEDIKVVPDMILRPLNGIKVSLTKR